MSAILPIPTSRTSDYLARTRLVQQIQSDQVDLLRLQNQLSTGRRIFVPSDDPGAGIRAISLQRTLERKDQLQLNVSNAAGKLSAAESSVTQVSDILNHVRSETLGVVGTIASDEQRATILQTVNEAIESLERFANSQHQDTFLFGGTRSLQSPYKFASNYVEYRGNESNLQANVEIGQLFDTNISGDEVFGGLSEPVRGSVDLNPQASERTFLSQLNGGAGVSPNGSIQLAVGLNTYVVDLSRAHSLGDVARMIEQGAPAGSGVRVDVGGSGLTVHPGPAGLAINEVSGGRTAQELGIRQTTPVPLGGSFGDDLNPVLRKTSRLDDLLGEKATGRLSLGASNANIKLTAKANGAAFNNVTVELVGNATPGNEAVSYTPGAPPVLQVSFAPGVTTAQDVVDRINADGALPFAASVDYFAAEPADRAGEGRVVPGSFVNATSGGSGKSLELDAGIRITNGDGEIVIDTSGAKTVEDLVNILNQPEYGLLAKVNDAGDGIDVRSRRSGADFTIGENGGTLAADLGIRTFVGSTRLEDFNRGKGVVTNDAHHLTLDHDDGSGNVTTYRVNLSNDAFGDFSGLAAPPTGSLDLSGSYQGASGNKLRIVFAEDAGATTHSAALSGNDLTITIGRSGLADGDTVDLDTVFRELTGADFTGSIHYTPGDLVGDYTVGTDNGAAVAFSGGGPPLTVDQVNARIGAATGGAVSAGIAKEGNGIDLSIDNSGGQTLRAHGIVAERLGFLDGSSTPGEAFDAGGKLSSSDRNTQEVQSAFNSLLRLREALQSNDTIAIGDAFESLEEDLNRATFARSEAVRWVRSLETLKIRLEDEEVQLRSTLSEAIDADLAEVISDFTARQFALQASLQTTASLLQMSVLNFIYAAEAGRKPSGGSPEGLRPAAKRKTTKLFCRRS